MAGIVGYKNYNNENLNVLNFEKLKWGDVRHGDLLYTLFDLKLFLKEDIQKPRIDNIETLQKILQTIEINAPDNFLGRLENLS